MGLDLSVLPISYSEFVELEGLNLCDNKLSFHRDYRLFDQICEKHRRGNTLEPVCSPKPMGSCSIYRDEGLIETSIDSYGDPLTFLNAIEFSVINLNIDNIHPWNMGIFSFLSLISEETKVVLYWH